MVDQCVSETIGLDGLACLRERQVLLGQNALGAEYHFHLVEPLEESQQELDAARKGDRLECREAGEEILPTRLLTAGQLGTKDRQRLSGPLQLHLGKEIIRDDPSSFIDSLTAHFALLPVFRYVGMKQDGDPRPGVEISSSVSWTNGDGDSRRALEQRSRHSTTVEAHRSPHITCHPRMRR